MWLSPESIYCSYNLYTACCTWEINSRHNGGKLGRKVNNGFFSIKANSNKFYTTRFVCIFLTIYDIYIHVLILILNIIRKVTVYIIIFPFWKIVLVLCCHIEPSLTNRPFVMVNCYDKMSRFLLIIPDITPGISYY